MHYVSTLFLIRHMGQIKSIVNVDAVVVVINFHYLQNAIKCWMGITML